MLLVVGAALAPAGLVRGELLALGLGAVVGLVGTGAAWVFSRRVTAGLRELHEDAVRRLRNPAAPTPERPRSAAVQANTELADLARVLDALQLRARVADEVAEQARRTAENASAGMFELLSGLVAAEEATRGQLSAELHDTVAQSLMAVRALLADPTLTREMQDRIREYVEDAEEQVRAVMARTRPPELREGDLASAIQTLQRDLAARYLLDVRLSWPNEPEPLPLVSAVTIYRFFQEALLNVVKHAEVDEADASLEVNGSTIEAAVHDNGPGFDPEKVKSEGGRHVGLGLLKERARLAGGSLDVESGPDTGTTLKLRLPLQPNSVSGLFNRRS